MCSTLRSALVEDELAFGHFGWKNPTGGYEELPQITYTRRRERRHFGRTEEKLKTLIERAIISLPQHRQANLRALCIRLQKAETSLAG